MSEIKHRYVESNGIRMHAAECGQGFPVLLCHGFPELWYSWRHQLGALGDAGFRAIAPDQRGYGETDAPAAVSDYTIHHLVGDLTGLLDALEIEKAVILAPKTAPPAKVAQLLIFGATVILVDGTYELFRNHFGAPPKKAPE